MAKSTEIQPHSIGPYQILKSLGKGGMGEVYLAQDAHCGRRVALKRVRPELKANQTIQRRFLREAQVASALSHPSIIPILTIQTHLPDVYYTMPFVEGDTLRQILKTTREQEKKGETLHPIGRSIPALAKIFLQICEAVAYTHAKGILHRDLKPENIIVGKFKEVMILDWGIADFIDHAEPQAICPESRIVGEDLTKPGKITGTLAYMAPERLKGEASSIQTDLYALGVILYQMLTLQLPFHRKNISAFRKQVHTEELIDPIDVAPYRDIPHQLSYVCHKCLAPKAADRYQSVEELILEIKSYIEGRPEWILAASLDPQKREDWRFQENILLAKNIAITRNLEAADWGQLMISNQSFADNIRFEADIHLGSEGQGVGILLQISEDQHGIEEGYCLWMGPTACKLFRNNVQVLEGKMLEPQAWHHIRIDKVDDHLRLYVDGRLKLSFVSHLPLAGSHVGLLQKDTDFEIKNCKVFDGSHNIMVGCLAVPNAFFSHKLYDVALQEYRRIGQCFPGRLEGREALFRAGLTLLEKGRTLKNEKYYHAALKEFEKLYKTSGAPLEYLGKSLVYDALGDAEEEAKCLELALRKFPQHPLLAMLKEHIVYRMHESSLNNREAAYRIILLAIRHIPELLENPDTRHLIDSLEKNWEPLPFIQKSPNRLTSLAIQLAFWLAKVPILVEIARSVEADEVLLNNALVCLQELDATDALEKFLPQKAPKKKSVAVWKLLLQRKLSEAKSVFDKFSTQVLQESSPLHFPYGTYLYMTQGQEAAMRHFASVLETTYPQTTTLPSLFLTCRLKDWMDRGFWWEKKELHRQIDLFYRCVGKPK